MNWCIRKDRVLKITGTGGPDDIYLIRYYIFRSRFFNVFIHQFLRSDRDDLHDHPWDFATYLVRGAYTELKWDGNGTISTRRRGPGTEEEFCGRFYPKYENRFVFRKATDQHQVLVDHDLKEENKSQAPLTICVTGRTKREWGFWKWIPKDAALFLAETIERDMYGCKEKANPLKRAWIDWRTYLGLPPDAKGRG